jgi:pyruvate/2-oxoglutarate dehydrogenase complex dihydrolipoamide dehydrogenase (E3) component
MDHHKKQMLFWWQRGAHPMSADWAWTMLALNATARARLKWVTIIALTFPQFMPLAMLPTDAYGDAVKVYRSDFRPMKNVVSGREERGLYKMVTHKADGSDDEKVIGLHMIGPDSSEILQAAAVAVKAGLNKQAFDDTVALHPSMSEELVLLK